MKRLTVLVLAAALFLPSLCLAAALTAAGTSARGTMKQVSLNPVNKSLKNTNLTLTKAPGDNVTLWFTTDAGNKVEDTISIRADYTVSDGSRAYITIEDAKMLLPKTGNRLYGNAEFKMYVISDPQITDVPGKPPFAVVNAAGAARQITVYTGVVPVGIQFNKPLDFSNPAIQPTKAVLKMKFPSEAIRSYALEVEADNDLGAQTDSGNYLRNLNTGPAKLTIP